MHFCLHVSPVVAPTRPYLLVPTKHTARATNSRRRTETRAIFPFGVRGGVCKMESGVDAGKGGQPGLEGETKEKRRVNRSVRQGGKRPAAV